MPYYISTRQSKKKYHTDPECHGLSQADTVNETDEEMIERRGLELCAYCGGDHSTDNYNDRYQKALERAARGDD